jgi:hypothetical protein
MKLQKGKPIEGGVLVVTIIICALVGLMLSAYLSMISSQHTFTQRSQVWNNAIPLCEAGIEEAMAHINHNSTLSNNFAINGWRLDGGHYKKERYINGGEVRMDIDNGLPPIITVRGTLKEPIGHGTVTRVVKVRTKMNQRFPAAVLARGGIGLNGSGRIDSYNSTNNAESTLGQYDVLKATANALVGTTLRTPGSISVGTMTLYGSGATGPGGTITVANSGSVGSKAWVESVAGKGKVEPGHHINDANYYIPPASLPSDFAPAALPMNQMYPPIVGGTNYKYCVLGDGDYRLLGNMLIGSGDKMLIAGQCRIHVTGTLTVGSSGFILLNTNGYVEFYCGNRVDIAGQGFINLNGYAKNFSIISLTSQPVSYGGQARLVGTFYAPLSAVNLQGTTDAMGAFTCDSFTLGGGMGIHFDEALKGEPKVRFIANSWTELKP